MSIACATPYRAPVRKPPVENKTPARFGIGRLEDYDVSTQAKRANFDIVFGSELGVQNNAPFTLPSMEGGLYGYFLSPKDYGDVRFRSSGGITGGWDGASWPDDGSTGDQYGPIAITRTNELGVSSTWYLYRTDFDGIGTYTYEVTFGH